MTRIDSLRRGPRGVGKAAGEFLADLAEARRAERLVVSVLADVREELAATVVHAKAKGVGYDRMAQATLRAVRSPTVTVAEREREAARLRKLVHRHRVTAGHAFPSGGSTETRSQLPDLSVKEDITMNKIIKRTVVEEFLTDKAAEHPVPEDLDDRDEVEVDDDDDEDETDTAARKPRRR